MTEFAELGLSQELLNAIEKMGFVEPTPIQKQAIPALLEGENDLVGLAQTGTGKTAAFGLPMMDLVDTDNFDTQALVLAPTRELCLQISKELGAFGAFQKRLKICAVYGGTDIVRQMKDIKRGAHIIVATPGRLRDLIRRKAVKINTINYVVLDEADEMLNMGFKEEIDDILSNTPDEKQTWLFSATMPKEVRRIAKNYMTDPVEISIGQQNSVNTDIEHQYVILRPSERFEAIKRFLDIEPTTFGLVFCRTRRESKQLAEDLSREGYSADALHGDLNQSQRDNVMDKFRNRRINILVATDVAARGIDVSDISHVYHYNIPDDLAFYTHRAGRTGRAGKKGKSIVLAHPNDVYLLRRMEKQLKIEFVKGMIPTGEDILKQLLVSKAEEIKEASTNTEMEAFLPNLEEALKELSREDLIKAIAKLSFSKVIRQYKNARDLNNSASGKSRSKERVGRNRKERRSEGYSKSKDNGNVKMFINVGEMDLGSKGELINLICKQGKIKGADIGKISMMEKHTFFDVSEDCGSKLMRSFKDYTLKGRSIRLNFDEPDRKPFKKKKKDKGRRIRR